MSKKPNLAKYKRLAKYMQIVIKVFLAASLIGLAIAIGMGLYLTFAPAASLDFLSNSNGSLSLSIDSLLIFQVNPQEPTVGYLRPALTSLCFMAAVAAVMLAIILRQLDMILNTVKNDTPFALENSKRLTIIATTIMIGAFVERFAEALAAKAIIDSLKLFSINVNFSPDSTMIIMGFIVFVLAGVFKYGSYLQKEYDATV